MKNFIVKNLIMQQIAVAYLMVNKGIKYENINDFINAYYFTLNNDKDLIKQIIKEVK